MSEQTLVIVPAAKRGEVALALLQAAETAGLEAAVVVSQTEGYLVPAELADAALAVLGPEAQPEPQPEPEPEAQVQPEPEPPAKKK